MNLSVFNYLEYKAFLRDVIRGESRGGTARLARSAGCQPSYLSQVLTRKMHLSDDQLFGISLSLSLDSLESEYLLELLHLEKAVSGAFRERTRAKLKKIKEEGQGIGKRIKREENLNEEDQQYYYSSWIPAVVHVCTDIPHLQAAEAIAGHLQLPKSIIERTLARLEKMKLVTKKENRWVHSGKSSHVDRRSPYFLAHHQNWRNYSLAAASKTDEGGICFSGIYAISESDFEKLKEKILTYIADVNQTVSKSPSERVVCFNCDWFSITHP